MLNKRISIILSAPNGGEKANCLHIGALSPHGLSKTSKHLQHTAKRVYNRLKELYGDEFDASDRAVRKFVADIRKELQMNADGFLPLEHPPGEAQADFGEARFKELLLKCDKDMNRMHYKGYGMIKDLFQEDKQEFFKLPKVPFEVYLHEFAKADNYGKIRFDGRVYSTSPNMTGRQVIVKAGAFDVEILDENCNHIIKHRRLYGEEKESMNWIPYLELMSRRPTALKYTGLYNQLPQILKEYLDKSDYEGKKQALKLLTKMTVAIWPRQLELQLVPEERW
jgi:hypothetical protein